MRKRPASESADGTPTSGRRRTALQDEQQRASRQKIVEAGAKVFNEKSYMLASVEDIIERAGISRVTFYKHFENKLDLAKQITMAQIVPELQVHYDRLAEHPVPTAEQIADWIAGIAGVFARYRSMIALLLEITAIDADYDRVTTIVHESLMARLAVSIAAFRAVLETEPDAEIRLRAHMLMRQLDKLCYDLEVNRWPVHKPTAIRLLAEQFHSFIQNAGRPP